MQAKDAELADLQRDVGELTTLLKTESDAVEKLQVGLLVLKYNTLASALRRTLVSV